MPKASPPRYGNDAIQVLRPTGATQHIDVLATSVASGSTFESNIVRISTTVDICYAIDETPTAVGDSTASADNFLPAGGVEYVRVVPNVDKIAVIAQDESTAGGIVYLGEYQ